MNKWEVDLSVEPKETLPGYFGRQCEMSYGNILPMEVCLNTVQVPQLLLGLFFKKKTFLLRYIWLDFSMPSLPVPLNMFVQCLLSLNLLLILHLK